MNLEYKAEFKKSDLIGDIAESIRHRRPGVDISSSRNLAELSLADLTLQGNMLIYRMLVESGTNYALIRADGGEIEPAI
ncbi:hypothetical protein J4422_02755 [Candidatus Pacearchaeota archaeon]|nr:hypothetical protein [Candidatus Pacearchaeota archaeon]